MVQVLVDSNILIDIFHEDKEWLPWSSEQLAKCPDKNYHLVINPVIYAEICYGFKSIDALDAALGFANFRRLDLPWLVAPSVVNVIHKYRKNCGTKKIPIPDFFIGAHALVEGMLLLTRDSQIYKTYFPIVKIISPN